jgi:hypothetical protein
MEATVQVGQFYRHNVITTNHGYRYHRIDKIDVFGKDTWVEGEWITADKQKRNDWYEILTDLVANYTLIPESEAPAELRIK